MERWREPRRAGAARAGHGRWAWGVRSLLALVLLPPLVGMVGLAAGTVMRERATASAAADATTHLREYRALYELLIALGEEQLATTGTAEAAALGLDPATASSLLGIDLQALLVRARPATDEALARSGDGGDLPARAEALLARLGDLRSDLDAGRLAAAESETYFRELNQVLIAEANERLGAVSTAVDDVPGTEQLRRAVDASRHFGRLALAAGNEIGLVARVVVGPEARIGSGELASFEQAAALFEVSEAAMTAEAPRSVEAAWQSVRASEAVRAYERLRPTLPPAPAEGVTNYGDARVLGAAIERALAVASFGRTLVASVEGAADAMRDQALGRAHRLQLAVGALTLVSVGVALLALRTLVRPLHQLARHAHRVSAGDLGAEAPALRGPAEIVVVRDAVEDLVMALRLIDAQAGALASGELRDPVLDEEVPGRIGDSLNRSVGRLSEVTAQLTHAATHDSLTGLANRAGALAVLDELAVTGRTDGQRKALLFIDLDGFKAVNDRHGHEVGDQLLRTVADRLAAAVRSHDLVARLGGDEFLVLTDAAGSVETAERLIASVARPAHHEVGELRVTASVGVAVAEPGLAPAELLRRADAAVYRAKARGKGCVVVHLAEASPDRPAHALRCTDTA